MVPFPDVNGTRRHECRPLLRPRQARRPPLFASFLSPSLPSILSRSISLSSMAIYSSLSLPWLPFVISATGASSTGTRCNMKTRARQMSWSHFLSPWNATNEGGGGTWEWPRKDGLDPSSPATVDHGSWSPQLFLDSLVVMVPLARDKSGRIYKHAFWGKLSKLWQLIRVKRGLIFR